MTSTDIPTATELASREADGVRVTLLWHRHEGFVSVVAEDSKTGEAFELVLSDADNALDVFHHPFAYAAYRGLLAHGSANEPALSVAA
jgi:hypothetical protein